MKEGMMERKKKEIKKGGNAGRKRLRKNNEKE